jgi:hypothetical protein
MTSRKKSWLKATALFAVVAMFVGMGIFGGFGQNGLRSNHFKVEGVLSATGAESVASASGTPLGTGFMYQGRLTDASGNPVLDDSYAMVFNLYDVLTGGSVLQTKKYTVAVKNGLFSQVLEFSNSYFTGEARYLGIEVGADSEMTPRQAVYAVPYAYSLKPGATIKGDVSFYDSFLGYWVYPPILKVQNTAHGGSAIYGYSDYNVGSTYGVEGQSNSAAGYGGYFHNAASGGRGVMGYSAATSGDGVGVYGESGSAAGHGGYFYNAEADGTGVMGYSSASSGVGVGVEGQSNSAGGYGGYFYNGAANGSAVIGYSGATSGDGFGVYGKSNSAGGYGGCFYNAAADGSAVIGYSSASSGDGVGVYGKSNSAGGYGGYFYNTAAGGTGLVGQAPADGVSIEAAGSGVIKSSAKSYIWVSGLAFKKMFGDSTCLTVYYGTSGTAYFRRSSSGTEAVIASITMPSVLYGQNVRVTKATVYYKCENAANYIDYTGITCMISPGAYCVLGYTGTHYNSTSPSNYDVILTNDNTLNSGYGAVAVRLCLHFADTTNYIGIGGVRLELEHD